MPEIRKIQRAADLPDEWDLLADSYFQQRKFLIHSEEYNPCSQRYYLLFDDRQLMACAVVYTIRLDLFTFMHLKSPVETHINGIPCSVSCPGIFGKPGFLNQLSDTLYDVEKGFVLALNLLKPSGSSGRACGRTLPSVIIDNRFNDWSSYLQSLRSHYRRRINQLGKQNHELRFVNEPCCVFSGDMYRLYQDVYRRSNAKLERLSVEYFRNLPGDFRLTCCYRKNQLVGWTISLLHNKNFYFFLGGIDYRYNEKCQTYLRLLLQLVNDGINCRASVIELGQTAEIPKLRMGGRLSERFMEARHSNIIYNQVLKLAAPALQYKRRLEHTRAMKEAIV